MYIHSYSAMDTMRNTYYISHKCFLYLCNSIKKNCREFAFLRYESAKSIDREGDRPLGPPPFENALLALSCLIEKSRPRSIYSVLNIIYKGN